MDYEELDFDPLEEEETVILDDSEPTLVSEPGGGGSRRNFRLVLVALLGLMLICLVGVVIYRVFLATNGGVTGPAPTPTPVAVEPTPTPPPPTEEPAPSPTPTRVIEEAAPEGEQETAPAEEAAPSAGTPTPVPTDTPTPPPPTPTPSGQPAPVVMEPQTANLLANGDFEAGFSAGSPPPAWNVFQSSDVVVAFSPEPPGPYVLEGSSALRMSIDQATQPDRYGGLYQQVEVMAGQPYTLELHGQIRGESGQPYDYRLQYAVDLSGGTDWRALPPDAWVELPWDAQPLGGEGATFMRYTTVITPTSDSLTLFIRGWNKWPDLSLAEYTLDRLSLTGPVPGSVPVAAAPAPAATPDQDQLIPTTGEGDSGPLWVDGRFWGAALVLLALVVAAVVRQRRKYATVSIDYDDM